MGKEKFRRKEPGCYMKKMVLLDVSFQTAGVAYDQHGDGSSIRFPVKMRKLFTQSLGSMMLLLRPQELTMKIKFIKITASCSRV